MTMAVGIQCKLMRLQSCSTVHVSKHTQSSLLIFWKRACVNTELKIHILPINPPNNNNPSAGKKRQWGVSTCSLHPQPFHSHRDTHEHPVNGVKHHCQPRLSNSQLPPPSIHGFCPNVPDPLLELAQPTSMHTCTVATGELLP